MAEYRNTDGSTTYVERRSNTGMIVGGIILAVVVIVGILFLTGFWRADVRGGSMPKVDVSAKGGSLPDVDVKSKQVVVGTTTKSVDVPKVETEKKTISVPVVGVKDGDNK